MLIVENTSANQWRSKSKAEKTVLHLKVLKHTADIYVPFVYNVVTTYFIMRAYEKIVKSFQSLVMLLSSCTQGLLH